ncbi:hypothetical protein [Neorhizobium galegae]|uniref:hypothetical protein n=1 Tax=Neorhizobium galegae TaxID=399 RepID=UPI001F2E367C|nr:hypothetical protein [Neorhizobium galegae]UIK08993.1 hypothetical protein LZK81_28760 [Neorhizobium galegae]
MTKNLTDTTLELSAEHLQALRWNLHPAPGATQHSTATFRPGQFSRGLKGRVLEVSAHHGIRLVPMFSQPAEHAVYIALPASGTLGDLLATMFVNIAPDLLLHSLRHLPGFDPGAESWQAKVDANLNAFIDMIEYGDHCEALEWLRDSWNRAFSLGPYGLANCTAHTSGQTSWKGKSNNDTGKDKA